MNAVPVTPLGGLKCILLYRNIVMVIRAKLTFPTLINVLAYYVPTQLDVGPQRPRSWHIVHPYYCQSDISTECQLIIFGGNAHINGDSGDRENIADLRILTFGKYKCH